MINLHQKQTTKKVFISFGMGLGGAALLVIIAGMSASYLNCYHFFSQRTLDIILCTGFIFDAAALYGQRGWDIQTWQGTSKPEQWNRILFRLFASLGLFFTVWGCLLKP